MVWRLGNNSPRLWALPSRLFLVIFPFSGSSQLSESVILLRVFHIHWNLSSNPTVRLSFLCRQCPNFNKRSTSLGVQFVCFGFQKYWPRDWRKEMFLQGSHRGFHPSYSKNLKLWIHNFFSFKTSSAVISNQPTICIILFMVTKIFYGSKYMITQKLAFYRHSITSILAW